MPRKTSAKPKPKSRQRKVKSPDKIRLFLGEDSSQNASTADETFQSAELNDQTDYGLDFTSSRATKPPNRHSTIQDSRKSKGRESPAPISPANNMDNLEHSQRKKRKQATPKRIEARFWKDVRRLQCKTDNLVPRGPFSKVIREIMIQQSTVANRITYTALEALQEAAETYLTALFQDSYCCTLHRGRITLIVRDIELARFLRGRSDPGNR